MDNNKVVKIKEQIKMSEHLLKLELGLKSEERNEVLMNVLKNDIARLKWCLDNQDSEFEVWYKKIRKEYRVFEYMPKEYRTVRNLIKLYLNGKLDIMENLTTREQIMIRDVLKLAEDEIMEQAEEFISVFGDR